MPAIYARDGRANNFHLIRHVAALCVILTHSFSIPTGLYSEEPMVSLTGTSIGHYAVDVFFLLSGFLITQSVVRNHDLVHFVLSRVLRVFPALIAGVFLTAFVLGPIVSSRGLVDYYTDSAVWQYALGAASTLSVDRSLPGVFAGLPEAGKVNIPLWTLKYELAAYALLGCLAAFVVARRRLLLVALVVALIGSYVVGRLYYPWPAAEGFISNFLHLVPAFLIGSAAYLCRRKIPYGLPLTAFLLIASFVLQGTPAYELTEKLLFASVIFWLAFLPSSLSEAFAKIGDYSYGLYIFAFPIQQTLYMAMPTITPIWLFVLSTLATLLIAALSWHFVEKPSMGLRGVFMKTWPIRASRSSSIMRRLNLFYQLRQASQTRNS